MESAGMGSGQPQPKPLLPPAASMRPSEKSPYDGGGQSQSPPQPGPWVWPHQWAPHLPCVQSQNTGVGAADRKSAPRALVLSRAVDESPEGTGLSDGILTTQ